MTLERPHSGGISTGRVHSSRLQGAVSVSSPSHSLPPSEGVGELQPRPLVLVILLVLDDEVVKVGISSGQQTSGTDLCGFGSSDIRNPIFRVILGIIYTVRVVSEVLER